MASHDSLDSSNLQSVLHPPSSISSISPLSLEGLSDRNAPTCGYPLTIIVGEVLDKLICSKCEQLLREPVQSTCGHR